MPAPLHRIPRTTPHAGLEARMAAEYLGTKTYDEVATYAELAELTGVNFQERSDLRETACTIARTVYGKEFHAIPGIGLLCLTETGKIGKVVKRQASTYRRTMKDHRILAVVDQTQLSPLEKHQWLVTATVAQHIAFTTHERTIAALTSAATPPLPLLTLAECQDVFKGL
jgi:hypothetical protein